MWTKIKTNILKMEDFIVYVACLVFCFLSKVSADCSTLMTSSVHSVIHKQGFHREIESIVSWIVKNNESKLDCSLLLVYHIPREMFVDFDEVRRLYSTKIIPLGTTCDFNVERPAHLSTEQSVLIYPNIKKENTNSYLKLESRSILPVHWRYQQPTENQYYVTFSLPGPTVFARCPGDISSSEHYLKQCFNNQKSVQYLCSSDTLEMCEWFSLKQNLNNTQNNGIRFTVPVGIKAHTFVVALGTITVTLSALCVLLQLPWLDVSNEKKL
mgnify:FL=1